MERIINTGSFTKRDEIVLTKISPCTINPACLGNKGEAQGNLSVGGETLPACPHQLIYCVRDIGDLVNIPMSSEEKAIWLLSLQEVIHPPTVSHELRVAYLVHNLSNAMGIGETARRAHILGALLHDIGKIAIPPEILDKPGKLTENEREVIGLHPEAGYTLLTAAGIPYAKIIARLHHCRHDLSGYPHGANITKMPWGVNLVAIADVLDAMSSRPEQRDGRVYSPKEALREVIKDRSKYYNSHIVTAYKTLLNNGFSFELPEKLGDPLLESIHQWKQSGNLVAVSGYSMLLSTASLDQQPNGALRF